MKLIKIVTFTVVSLVTNFACAPANDPDTASTKSVKEKTSESDSLPDAQLVGPIATEDEEDYYPPGQMHLNPGRIPTVNEIVKGLSIMCEAHERPGMATPVLPGIGEDGCFKYSIVTYGKSRTPPAQIKNPSAMQILCTLPPSASKLYAECTQKELARIEAERRAKLRDDVLKGRTQK